MKTASIYTDTILREDATHGYENMQEFYDNATTDYLFWDKNLNMHFGYSNGWKDVFNREKMIEQLNVEIFKKLNIQEGKLADLGCGMGGVIQYGLKHFPKLQFTGFTLSAYQYAQGNKLLNSKKAKIECADYNQLSVEDKSFDAAYAIESFCHSGCSYTTLEEAHRILKTNGKLLITDAFTKTKKLSFFGQKFHDGLCKHWFLEKLGNIQEVKSNLEKLGFVDIEVKEISWKVAPSVLHVPFAVSGFVMKRLLGGKRLEQQTIHNLLGSVYSLLTGLFIHEFGYYMIVAKKI